MGFPLRDKIMDELKLWMVIQSKLSLPFFVRGEWKIHFRQEANHKYSHPEWNCHSGSFKIFHSV